MKQWKKSVAMVLGVVIGITICGGGLRLVKAAQTYYVSHNTGNDSNVGTSKSKAFKTLKKAVSSAQEGDVIRILDTLHQTESLDISKGVTIGRAADMTDYMIVVEDGSELTLRGDVVLTGRKASVSGKKAMIRVKEGATLTVKGKAKLINNLSESLPGGAVVNLGTMNISGNCVFENNITGSHGGGAIYNAGILKMEGGIIRNNTAGKENAIEADERCGGGVLNGGTFKMSSGTISGNDAIGGGGGVHNVAGSSFEFSGGIISNNICEGRGGGVNCVGATFSMTGGEISGNVSVGGGGIHLGQEESEGSLFYSTISGGTIIENKSIFSEEDSTVGSGGGVLVRHNNILAISGGSILKNSGENCGGGVRVGEKGKVIIQGTGVRIEGNHAEKGGGTQVKKEGQLQFVAGSIQNNTATQGGGIHVRGECIMTGGSIVSNSAPKGNAIYHNGQLSMSGNVTIDAETDTYLCDGKYVVLPGNINNSEGEIILMPSDCSLGRVCVRVTKADTKASVYKNKFLLKEEAPYLLRPGDYLAASAGVHNTDLIISRDFTISYDANIKQAVSNLPEKAIMYWKETGAISDAIPVWSELSKFIEWNTDKEGNGTAYKAGETIEMPTEDLHLFAQWSNLPPEITARDSYLVEDEIETRLTKNFLRGYGKALDPEEGDISENIKITNWDKIILQMNEPYSSKETSTKLRKVEVNYEITDSCGASAQAKAQLTIFLLVDDSRQKREGYVRFLEQEYIEKIEENTYWGSDEMKAFLTELLKKDTSDIEWEN